MGRLRNQIIGLVVFSAVAATFASVVVAVRAFIEDKQTYVLELSSASALNAATVIGRQLDSIEQQFAIFTKVLDQGKLPADLLETTFRGMAGVERLDIFDVKGRLAGLRAPGSPESYPAVISVKSGGSGGTGALLDGYSALDPTRRLAVLVQKNGGYTFQAILKKDFFAENLEASRALAARWVTDDGVPVLVPAEASQEDANADKVSRQMLDLSRAQPGMQVLAKELVFGDQVTYFAAIAPLPHALGTAIVMMVPGFRVSQLARQVLKKLVPFALLVLGILVGLGILSSSRVVRPIEALTDATSKISSGDWKVVLSFPRSSLEIRKLVGSFSRMVRQLEARERDLSKAQADLARSERLASLGRFSAGLAHEIKNPLNAILGFAQVMERKIPATDESNTRSVKFILDETRRANRIISDLLTFARQKPPTLVETDVVAVVRRSGEMFATLAQAQRIGFRVEAGAPLPARVDPEQIHQVLQNLFNNAVHAVQDKGGESGAGGEPAAGGEIELRCEKSGEFCAISVKDNGVGISPENRARMFEPFFSTKGVGRGTGLGLALCHGIIEAHHGRIEIESEFGKGTTFRVLLPNSKPDGDTGFPVSDGAG